MAVAVAQNTNDNWQAREEKVAHSAAPKLPSEKFAATIGILQDFLLTPNEADLPALWHHWANCTKRQEFNVLSEQLHAYTRSQDAFGPCAPIASAKVVQDLLSFTFVGESSDDIKTGIQPFVITDGSSEHHQANLDLARTYGLLIAGEQSLMLADLEALKAKEVQSTPLKYFELERNFSMFGNLLGTVLGTRHILTTKYGEFWVLLSQRYRLELQHIIDNKRYIKPAHILRSLQLICFNWFSIRRAKLTPQAPDFTSMLQNIVLNTYVVPHLPPALYRLAYPKPTLAATPSVTGSSGSSSTNSGSGASINLIGAFVPSGIASVSSSVFGISTPTTYAGTRPTGTHIHNITPDATLVALLEPGTKIKDLIGNDPPFTLDNGHHLCLSHALQGGCWSTCRRVITYGHTFSPAEKTRLTQYIQTQKQKLRVAGPPQATHPGRQPGKALLAQGTSLPEPHNLVCELMLNYSNYLVNYPLTSSNCNNTLTHSHPLQPSQSPHYQHAHIVEPPVEPTQHPVDPTHEPISHSLPLVNITSRPYPVSPPTK
jgi:hypothetical protein